MQISKHSLPIWAALLLFLFSEKKLAAQATPASNWDSKIVRDWNDLFLELERYAPGFRPCPAGAAAGYLGFSFYESVVPGIAGYQSQARLYAGLSLPAPPSGAVNWAAATNESYAYLMAKYFNYVATSQPTYFQKIAALRQSWDNTLTTAGPTAAVSAGKSRGLAVATAVWAWLETDAAAKGAWLTPQPVSYVPPAGPGLWAPTLPDQSRAMFPYYGDARPFALPEAEKTCAPPPAYSEAPGSVWRTQAEEVFNDVNDIRAGGPVGYEKQWRAEFWSDDLLNVTFSPPSRLLAIANQLAVQENLNLADAAVLYAKLGMAMNDAAIALWKSKYVYNVERPVTYIRRVLPGGAAWLSALDNPITGVDGLTPAFPAYPSGHSGFGGLSDGIFSDFFGASYTFTDNTHLGRTEFIGTPRTFTSFKQMGEENAYSRIPLGVHFRFDCDAGLAVGRLCAKRVLEMPWLAPDCALVKITPGAGQIEVRGLNSPIVLVQIFNASWQKVFDFTGAPGVSSLRTATGLATGTYYVKVNLLNSSWGQICQKDGYFNVTSGGGVPTGSLTFNQPADISVTAASGATGATVSFSMPSATSTCPAGAVSVVQTSGPASGATFPIGQTPVCFKATDGCGNTATRCLTVTVNPSVPPPPTGCSGITFTPSTGQIVVGGLTAPIVIVQAFNAAWQQVYNFNGATAATRTISGLASGNYFVKVDFFAANWSPICSKEATVTVGGTPPPPPTTGADVEVSISADKTTCPQWGTVNYSIKIKNAGTAALTSATVKIGGCAGGAFQKFEQAFGMVYAATPTAPTAGSYNFVTQEWAVAGLAAGQTATLNISLFALTGLEKKVAAFCSAQSPAETDSQASANPPTNCTPGQDDEAVWTVNGPSNGQAVTPQSSGATADEVADFTLFPNPAESFCTIDLTNFVGEKLAVSVTDVFGKTVFFEKTDGLKTAQFDLDLSRSEAGVYFVKIEPDGRRPVAKRLVLSKL